MKCPFTADRLRELFVVDSWRPEQIATLASAATGEATQADDVIGWLRDAGMDPDKKPARIPLPAPRSRRAGPRAPGRREGGMETRECDWCGEGVTRWPSDFCQFAYCNMTCYLAARHRRKEENRKRRGHRRRARAPFQTGEKRCRRCGEMKPIGDFALDVSRSDGRTRDCKECSREKSREYYIAHQERLRERARDRKREQAGRD